MEGERGFSLIEALVATALLSIIAVAFLSALLTSTLAAAKADGMATAEALAKSEIEYIMAQTYQPNVGWGYTEVGVNTLPSGDILPSSYSIIVTPSAIAGIDVSDVQQVSVHITRSTSGNRWLYVDYTVTDYWRNP